MSSHWSLHSLANRIGENLGVSGWHQLDQSRISSFANITEDFQYIHVDPERAAQSVFGGTIAHGFLVMSLLSVMLYEALGEIEDVATSLNYGFESIRFLAPAKSGVSVRGRFTLKSVEYRSQQQLKLVLATTIEIQGEDKPALVADWIILLVKED